MTRNVFFLAAHDKDLSKIITSNIDEKLNIYENNRFDLPWMGKYGQYFPWKLKQYIRQNRCCFYCKQEIAYDKITIDHKIPISKGGTNTKDNRLLACESCNLDKADTDFKEYLLKINWKK